MVIYGKNDYRSIASHIKTKEKEEVEKYSEDFFERLESITNS